MMKEAYLYKRLDDLKLRCNLCSHRCVIPGQEKGKCGVRKNVEGKLYSLVYDKIISENVDPIEKKPLFHFLPGTMSLSIATMGCNFKCFFCQNWQISQMPCDHDRIEGEEISPEKIVKDALASRCESVSYTYTEPTVFFELAYDTACIANKSGLKNIFVTNGFMTPECIEMIGPYLDAANVDLKSFSDDFYKSRCGGRLKPVLENIKTMYESKIWVEVTTLLIPGLNDNTEELDAISGYISGISRSIPWHVSAYYPQYKSEIPGTRIDSIKRAINSGKKAGLKYVYGGNIAVAGYEDTECHNCGTQVIRRSGFNINSKYLQNGLCGNCSSKIDGIF